MEGKSYFEISDLKSSTENALKSTTSLRTKAGNAPIAKANGSICESFAMENVKNSPPKNLAASKLNTKCSLKTKK